MTRLRPRKDVIGDLAWNDHLQYESRVIAGLPTISQRGSSLFAEWNRSLRYRGRNFLSHGYVDKGEFRDVYRFNIIRLRVAHPIPCAE